jgi:hypothetical protein
VLHRLKLQSFRWAIPAVLALGCTAEVERGAGGTHGAGATAGKGGSAASTGGGPGTGGGVSSGGGPGSGGTGTGGTNTGGMGSGATATGGTTAVPTPEECESQALNVGSAPLRRLSSKEYLNTLADLFPNVTVELPDLPTEAPVDSFDNDARALGPSDVYASRWEEIAFRHMAAVTATPTALAAFLPCASAASDVAAEQACGAELVAAFGPKTHRRPLTAEETARYRALFDAQLAAIDFEAAVQLTGMALLQSPAFLYRVEPARGAVADGTAPLDPYEMASRLSYFLWQRMPDQALLDAAARGELTDPASIEMQARRMLEDPRARAATVDFHRQWLFFDRILAEEHAERVDDLFPDWNAATQSAAYEELLRFTGRAVFEGPGTLAQLFLSRETEVNGPLAAIYGVDGPNGADEWQAVSLPANERAGFLTKVGFLAAHSHGANGSPPLRGSYIMQRIFCLPVDPPPPGTDTTPPDPTGSALTNREQFEERTSPADCRGCHAMLNPFGFALEHYDAVGGYRATDNGQPVDAIVELVDTDVTGQVNGGIELSEKLAASQQVADCAVSRWFRYARGRGVENADACAVQRAKSAFAASGGNIVDFMVSLATSEEFRRRPAGEE